MSQVIIVSNRLPLSVKKEAGKLHFQPSVGGLATGLTSYVSDRKNKWIGWPGIASDELTAADKEQVVTELAKHNYSPVFLTKRQIDNFYNGYSNSVLWPFFHNLALEKSASLQSRRWWQAYRSVNQQFAEAVIELARPNSRIWVHDYQLMVLPQMLQTRLPGRNIGFFLHIPFPAAKLFSRLPEHKELLKGMLGADLIGFHTLGYVDAFLENVQQAAVGVTAEKQVIAGQRVVRVDEFPMGIDYKKYASAAKSRDVKAAVRRYRKRYKGLKIIAAVDRLDPSKGLVERLKAYRALLERNPALRCKVVFSMIAAPSRTEITAYQRLARRLDILVSEVNKTYGTPKWQPIDYINTAQPFEEVTALFQVADVAFIAPLRDGMNLAAKEFVASKRKRGVLILSQTAGAAEELSDALIVNPKQPSSLVDALQKALVMPPRELRQRLKNMQRQLSRNTVQTWAKTFVETLQQPVPGTRPRVHTLKDKHQADLLNDYRAAKKRLLLLDYDGSLMPFTDSYKTTKPSSAVLKNLANLSTDPGNDIVLVSGRQADDLEKWLGKLNISLVGEHGAVIKKIGSKSWQIVAKGELRWKRAVLPTLERYTELTPGARIEIKPHSLVWHYRAASPYHAQKYAVTIKRVLRPLLKTYGLELHAGHKVLEIKDPRINKGSAVQYWLQKRYDFILAMGDDVTDEALFAILPPSAYSIKIGRGRTSAKYRLDDPAAVHTLLRKLAK